MSTVLDDSPLVWRIAAAPVLCWVCMRHSDKPVVRLVYRYADGLFCADQGLEFWPFARALTADDVAAFLMVGS